MPQHMNLTFRYTLFNTLVLPSTNDSGYNKLIKIESLYFEKWLNLRLTFFTMATNQTPEMPSSVISWLQPPLKDGQAKDSLDWPPLRGKELGRGDS